MAREQAEGGVKLFIKGPLKSAKREAARRGIGVRNCRVNSRTETVCETSDASPNKVRVMQWFSRTDVNVPGRGYAPGALLFFNGARRRRRRRR
jgi:hypothetical protein